MSKPLIKQDITLAVAAFAHLSMFRYIAAQFESFLRNPKKVRRTQIIEVPKSSNMTTRLQIPVAELLKKEELRKLLYAIHSTRYSDLPVLTELPRYLEERLSVTGINSEIKLVFVGSEIQYTFGVSDYPQHAGDVFEKCLRDWRFPLYYSIFINLEYLN